MAWIPIPPAIMVGLLCGTMAYALLAHLFSLRQWETERDLATDEASLFASTPEELLAQAH